MSWRVLAALIDGLLFYMDTRHHWISRYSLRWLGTLLGSVLAACAGSSWRDYTGPDWRDAIEVGTDFQHRVVFKPGRGGELHIYIEGDGNIWRTPEQLYPDPTPAQPLTIQLMSRDPAPALLLGRPCYFSVDDLHCAPRWWTAARYSEPVVASMSAVAARWSERYRSTMLIGYSGGGALATLMAPRVPHTRALVTLSANLDTAAWAAHHHYGAAVVGDSLNPSAQTPLPPSIAQWHFAGAQDDNILWTWIAAYSARQDNAHFRKMAGFDHRCCWLQQWPALLAPAMTGNAATAADQNSRR